jgi:hypothetical protein
MDFLFLGQEEIRIPFTKNYERQKSEYWGTRRSPSYPTFANSGNFGFNEKTVKKEACETKIKTEFLQEVFKEA